MGFLFLILGIVFVLMASHPKWRKKASWGRGSDCIPMSAFGWFAWIQAFFTISAAYFELIGFWWIFSSVTVVFSAGVFDSMLAGEKHQKYWLTVAGWIAFASLIAVAVCFGWFAIIMKNG